MTIEEEILIRKSLNGEQEAFGKLIAPHYEQIKKHCYSVVHDWELAEDLTQETFLRAFQKLNTFQKKSSFYTWVWKIAHNLSLNSLRKEKQTHLPLNEEILSSSTDSLPEESWDRLLSHLNEKQKEIFDLYYIKKCSQKEIAYLLNIPYGTVRSRLFYIRRLFKELSSKSLQ